MAGRASAGGPLLDADGPAAPPRANGELVFEAPWESRVFGIAVALHQRGLLDWERFRQNLCAEIGEADRSAVSGAAASYYACWQRALEATLAEAQLCTGEELCHRAHTYARRPHGHDHG